MYILKMKSGDVYRVTPSEYKVILTAEKGVVIPRLSNALIDKGSIGNTYNEDDQEDIEDKRNMQTGRLHDGTRVRRHFGQWVDDGPLVVDEKGNYVPVRIDPHYYPEVAQDKVFSEIEFEKIKHLPTAERLQLVSGGEVKKISEGLTKIGV